MKRLQTALLLAVVFGTGPAAADNLGRLFMTPAQRAALDRARNTEPAPEIGKPTAADEFEGISPEPELSAERVRVDGYVARANGRQTVWVNGVDSYQGNLGEIGIDSNQIQLEAPRVRLPIGTTPGGVLLKPGQSFDPNSDRIIDAYEREPERIGDILHDRN